MLHKVAFFGEEVSRLPPPPQSLSRKGKGCVPGPASADTAPALTAENLNGLRAQGLSKAMDDDKACCWRMFCKTMCFQREARLYMRLSHQAPITRLKYFFLAFLDA